MKELKNILLVSGSGRNCGKTTLVCHAISQLAKNEQVFGLKISPHFHLTASNQQIITEGPGYRIFRETDTQSGKDSARMLNAGATAVYFIQCTDTGLPQVYEHLKQLIPEDKAVICESGSFASVYRPGFHILIKGVNVDESKKSYIENLERADIVFTQVDFSPSSFPYQLHFSEQNWSFQESNLNPVQKPA